MTPPPDSDRPRTFDTLDDAVASCRVLLQTGYERTGNWTLAQACRHLRLTIEANMHGYPAWMTIAGLPLRPLLRAFVLPRVLAGRSVRGVRTAGMFVPPDGLDDEHEVERLEECVAAFERHTSSLHAHPGFGRMAKDRFGQLHAAHAAHHLSFLVPRDGTSRADADRAAHAAR